MEIKEEQRRGWCGPCHHRCGLLLTFEGDRAVKVQGDPNHPLSRGHICSRGKLILDHLYHPDRLNYPLKRIGEKGEGKWKRISWDDALDEIGERLGEIKEKWGPEALTYPHGTYRTYGWPVKRFFNLFGSPNIHGAVSICRCNSWVVEWVTYGSGHMSDFRDSRCIVLLGRNPSESCVFPEWAAITMARKDGAKLIVIDPRRTQEARLADLWLQIRPGTDLALLLCWINIIIGEELYDKDFVAKWTHGFNQLKEGVKSYTPDKVEEITWVPKDKIVEGARLYATVKPSCLGWNLAMDKQGYNAIQVDRARCILHAITGNLDMKGGELIGRGGLDVIADVEMELNHLFPPEKRKKQLGADKFRLQAYPGWEMIEEACRKVPREYALPPVTEESAVANSRAVWDAILTGQPYPVKAMISQASNPLLTLANTKLVYQALKNLSLYVVMDYYMTPSAQLADYVLPAAGTLERSDIADMHSYTNFSVACPKAMEPLYERRDDYVLWQGLGVRLGQREYWPWETIEDSLDYRLKPAGLTFKDLVDRYAVFGVESYKKYEKYGFATPTGKVEFYSTILEKLGYQPIPQYKEPPLSPVSNPEMAKEYPFILVTGMRFMPLYHSEYRQIEKVRKEHPDPLAEIHPKAASSLGISEGDWAYVENHLGRVKFKIRVTDNVHPKVVHVEHGWWFPEKPGEEPSLFGLWESNANVLCPDDYEYSSPEAGCWPHTALLCKVVKAS